VSKARPKQLLLQNVFSINNLYINKCCEMITSHLNNCLPKAESFALTASQEEKMEIIICIGTYFLLT
jgi:hypothetical protein